MMITATSEQSAEVIAAWRIEGSWAGSWWEIRVVGWISQDTKLVRTRLYCKWQIGSHNYWPYWNDTHSYTLKYSGDSTTRSFALNQDRSNTYIDKSSIGYLDFYHDATTGVSPSETINITGYKCWEAFETNVAVSFPNITIPTPSPEPTPEPEEEETPVPVINDRDPKFYIYADDEILYSLTDEDYYILNPKLTLELNQIDSLEFTIAPSHALYSSLMKLKTTIEVKQGTETLFRGRVLNDDTDFYKRKQVHCEGALSFLGDTIMPPYSAGTYSTAKDFFKAAINLHTQEVPNSSPKRKLKYVTCNVSTAIDVENEEYSQTSDVISTLLNDVGGYLKLEYYSDGSTGLSYLSAYEHTSSQIIDFGENLLDLAQSVDAADIYTSVVCLGAKDEETGVRIKTGSGNAMYVEDADAIRTFGRIIRIFTYDDVTSVSELQALAKYQLAIGVQQSITISIKAIDLHLIYPDEEKIRIGDTVRIRSVPHGIDSYFQCSRIDMDLQSPDNTVYTFGATIKALTDTTSKK